MAQLVKRPTSAQAMISQFVGSSPKSGSALTTWSLLGILSLKINIKKKFFNFKKEFCILEEPKDFNEGIT